MSSTNKFNGDFKVEKYKGDLIKCPHCNTPLWKSGTLVYCLKCRIRFEKEDGY